MIDINKIPIKLKRQFSGWLYFGNNYYGNWLEVERYYIIIYSKKCIRQDCGFDFILDETNLVKSAVFEFNQTTFHVENSLFHCLTGPARHEKYSTSYIYYINGEIFTANSWLSEVKEKYPEYFPQAFAHFMSL